MKVLNVIASAGTYTAQNGEEKTRWNTIGALFVKEDGKLSLKLETIPVGWNGQAVIVEREQREQAPAKQQQQEGGLPF